MNYHIARDGQQLGIFTREEALARYSSGEIRATDLAWCEGMAGWSPVSEVFGASAAPGVSQPVASAPVAAAPVYAAPAAYGALPAKPTNYLVPAILVTLFCCWPFGIPAIVFAAQVDGKYSRGDYTGAQDSANKAKMWMWISAGVGLLVGLAYGIFMAVMIASGSRY